MKTTSAKATQVIASRDYHVLMEETRFRAEEHQTRRAERLRHILRLIDEQYLDHQRGPRTAAEIQEPVSVPSTEQSAVTDAGNLPGSLYEASMSFEVASQHRISPIVFLDDVSGDLLTASFGYAGPGVGFSVGDPVQFRHVGNDRYRLETDLEVGGLSDIVNSAVLANQGQELSEADVAGFLESLKNRLPTDQKAAMKNTLLVEFDKMLHEASVSYFNASELLDEFLREAVTPPGKEKVVKKLKEEDSVDNPWAVAWGQYLKEYPDYKKKSESSLKEASFDASMSTVVVNGHSARVLKRLGYIGANEALRVEYLEGPQAGQVVTAVG